MKKINKLITGLILSTGVYFVSATNVFAQNQPTINLKPGGQFAALENISFSSLVSGGIRLILVVAALLFFFMLVIGGIQWIVAGGDKTGAENARKRIQNALVGLAIVFAAWAIVTLINTLFGVNIFQLSIPSFQGGQSN